MDALGKKLPAIIDYISKPHAFKLATSLSHVFSSSLKLGESVPKGYHFIYFNQPYPEPELNNDGYSNQYSDFRVNQNFNLRWLNGSIEFINPLMFGMEGQCVETYQVLNRSSNRRKVGIERLIEQQGALKIKENRTFSFLRADSKLANRAKHTCLKTYLLGSNTMKISETMMFRYSCLCFNAHKIHYNATYAKSEGLDGVIAPAPLLVALAMEWLERKNVSFSKFEYSIKSPVYANDEISFVKIGKQMLVLRGNEIIMSSTCI